MEVVRINNPENFKNNNFPSLVMALGYFDGVHLGHQKVIGKAKEIAEKKGWKSGVMTFAPHPSEVLGDAKPIALLTSYQTKIEQMEKLGIDYIFIIHFTKDFANLLPQQFVDQCLINLNVQHVVAGFDYTYGKMAKGTAETLKEQSRNAFETTIIKKETYHGEKVSSTLIRTYIQKGEMDKVPSLLGRFYISEGIVIHGDKRGRTIGFPTANIESDSNLLLPPQGVYAVKVKVGNVWHNGVCNVGTKPTFKKDNKRQSIEVHIFDFKGEIYGEKVVVEWHIRLRSEQKFAGIEELVNQIQKDKQQALEYFHKK
ncbi:riboflavin biosynthesis protein RibF [Niallia sp. NCCP-28]|uniref:riboflavin biosynthesis protein RibF n=1 Tax=Niallia sp. NCCP-28 TaxID=2934712 RepID=UPI00207FB449|nr:riboflavin biosynthesis protein RibF [Niallia sp. NCCP-28]GKU82518.1 riboflavin biosynthesis protein [Niallia sp. NCCP-28]